MALEVIVPQDRWLICVYFPNQFRNLVIAGDPVSWLFQNQRKGFILMSCFLLTGTPEYLTEIQNEINSWLQTEL